MGLFDDAAQTQLRVAFYGIQQCIFVVNVTGTDHCKSGGTALIQVACGHGGCGYIVWGHVIHNAPRGTRANDDQRKINLQIIGRNVFHLAHGKDHAIGHRGVELLQQIARAFRGAFRIRGDVYGIVALAGGLDGAVGQLGQIWRNQRRHGKGDETGVIAVEVAGSHIDSVVEVLNDRLDLGTGLICHTPGAIDHVRRSFERYTGGLSDIA